MPTIKLLSQDDVLLEFVSDLSEQDEARLSHLILQLIEDEPDAILRPIFIPQVSGATLEKVLTWCRYHKSEPLRSEGLVWEGREIEIPEWDLKYFQVEQDMLFNIITAAYTLEINTLTQTGCKVVANMIKGKSAEEIRQIFNIENDFTPEEEEQIRRENEWAQDDPAETPLPEISIKRQNSKLTFEKKRKFTPEEEQIRRENEWALDDSTETPVPEIAIRRQNSELTFEKKRKKGLFADWRIRVRSRSGKKD